MLVKLTMTTAPNIPNQPASPDPETDQDDRLVPGRIADVILLAQVLAAYGRFLAATIPYGALWRGFATVAQFFGTAKVADMMVRILRGLLRAEALERVLLARAKRGGDLKALKPRESQTRSAPTPAPSPLPPRARRRDGVSIPRGPRGPGNRTAFTLWSADPLPEAWADWENAPRRSPDELLAAAGALPETGSACRVERVDWTPPLTLADLPSLQQLEEEVRRRPVGQTVTEICLDLGISPSLCAQGFWDRIMWTILDYRGSLAKLRWQTLGRQKQLEKDDWKYPKLPLPEQTLEGMQDVVGFLIGEPPVDPFRPVPAAYAVHAGPPPDTPEAAAGTGPP